jgi:acyl carrier protein
MTTRDRVLADFLVLLREASREWDVDGGIGEQTRLFGDLNFESLDLVVLGTAVQEHYGRTFPFAEFFTHVGARQQKDVTVAEWVDFTYRQLEEGELARATDRGTA